MIPHIQTDTSKKNGNCWQTAIASVLDMPADDVPHFIGHSDAGYVESWWTYTFEWLLHHGYRLNEARRHLYTNEYYLVTGSTQRNTYHVCVYLNGKMVHDPHPSGVGLVTEDNFLVIRTI